MTDQVPGVMSNAEIYKALEALGPLGAWAVRQLKQDEKSYVMAHEQAMANGAEATRLRAELVEAHRRNAAHMESLASQLTAANEALLAVRTELATTLNAKALAEDAKPVPLVRRVSRLAEAIACPACGGFAERAVVTESEDRKYGCGRRQCCSRAFVCGLCHARLLGQAEAPEDWN